MKKTVLLVIMAVIVFGAYGCSKAVDQSQVSTGVGKSGICLEEFNKISMGMSEDEAEDIIGGKGILLSEKQNDTEEAIDTVYLYRYEGEKAGYAEIEYTIHSPKEIDFKFHRPEVSAKTQYNLS